MSELLGGIIIGAVIIFILGKWKGFKLGFKKSTRKDIVREIKHNERFLKIQKLKLTQLDREILEVETQILEVTKVKKK